MLRNNLENDSGRLSLKNIKCLGASSFFLICISVLYPFAIVLYSFFGGQVLQLGSSLAGAAVFFLMLLKKTRMNDAKKIVMLFLIFLLALCGWYGALWTDMRSYGAILVFASCLGVAWATLEFRLSKYVYEYPFYILLIITCGLIILGTDQYEFNSVLAVGSRNVYSAILLACAMGYLFSRRLRGESASIVLGVVLVVVSFFLYSRTGLVLSFGLLFLFVFGSSMFRPWLIFVCGLLISLVGFLSFDVGDFIVRNSNFEKGVDSPRFVIWGSYLSSVDAFNLLFGYNLESSEIISGFGGNPHSAYLRLHSYFGLGFFCLLAFSLVSSVFLISRRQWLCVLLAFCFYFRAVFDPVYFIWVFDYIFYPFVFFVFFDSYFVGFRSREARGF